MANNVSVIDEDNEVDPSKCSNCKHDKGRHRSYGYCHWPCECKGFIEPMSDIFTEIGEYLRSGFVGAGERFDDDPNRLG